MIQLILQDLEVIPELVDLLEDFQQVVDFQRLVVQYQLKLVVCYELSPIFLMMWKVEFLYDHEQELNP